MKHGRNIKRLLLLNLLAFAVAATTQEMYYDLSNTTGTADYLLGTKLVEDASYTTSALSFSSIISDQSRAYLELSHTQVYPFSEYSSSNGELGLQLRYLEIKDNQLFSGLFVYLNRYDDRYSYYNSAGFGMYGKWKHYFKADQLFTVGYDLNIQKFEEIAETSSSEHEFYAQYNQSFKTKTSLKLQSAIGVQNFWSQTPFSGRGRNTNVTGVDDIPSNTLVSTELRLSQSLGPKIGLTLWLESQTLLNKEADPLSLRDALENPFMDRFRWEGPSSSLRLLYRLNSKNSLQVTHSYFKKSYLDVPVYLFDFQVMDYSLVNEEFVNMGFDRDDKHNSFQFQWTKDWTFNHYTWLSDLELVMGTGWTQNRSNDPLYDYESINYSVSLNFNN